MSEAEILAAALALPKSTRAEVVLRLVDSLDDSGAPELSEDEWEAQVLAEVKRRREAFQRGEMKAIPAAEALESVRARLARGS